MPQFNGKNILSSKNMFVNRVVYNAYILTLLEDVYNPSIETRQIKDFQKDEKMFYGRIDQTIRNPIFPRSEVLTSFSTPARADGIQAINFVVDAFTQMKYKFDRDMRNGNLNPDSVALGDLGVYKAYTNPILEYEKHIENIKLSFRNYVVENNLIKQIKDFRSFIPVFLQFVNLISKSVPITRTMFFLSRFITPRISGLVIEVYNANSEDYGDDTLKEELFYRDRNFEYFKNLAYVFGFMVDKHIPWRLVADLNSPRMKDYVKDKIPVENPTASSVLSFYYSKTYPDDLNTLINMLVASYNEIVRFEPRTNIISTASTINKNSSRTSFSDNCRTSKTIYRSFVSAQDVIASNEAGLWLETYAQIRNEETGLDYNPNIMQEITERAKDLANSLDTDTALGYIAKKFDNVEHFNGSLFYDVTRLDLAEDPNASEQDVEEVVRRSVQASNFVIY
jgi:hypothetical protein